MAKGAGKNFLLYEGSVGAGTLVAACSTLSMNRSFEAVEANDKDSNDREILEGIGIKALSISFSGLFSDVAILETIEGYAEAQTLNTFHLRFPLLDSGNTTYKTVQASFYISSYSFTGSLNDVLSFEMTLESSGAVTRVAEAA